MKYFLLSVFTSFTFLCASDLQKDLLRVRQGGFYEIQPMEKSVLALKNKTTGIIKYVDIADQKAFPQDMEFTQYFDLATTPDSLFEDKYTLISRIELSQLSGYPLIFGDFNHNNKLDIAGTYKIIQDYEIAQAGIFEIQDDGNFALQYLYTYSDSSIQPLSLTDLDKDGLLELNIKRTQTFRNYEQSAMDLFPSQNIFDHRMWQMSGMVGSETFDYIDDDSLMDVVYVGDDTLDPWGNKFYIAEYKPELNNFVQVGRFPFPEWRVSGVSVSDFDGDGLKEIVTGSIHGDIYVVENTGDDSYTRTFTSTINTSNAYLNCKTNDIDHNGKPEFFIGASSFWDGVSGTRVCWFESDGNNNYIIQRQLFMSGTGGIFGTHELYSYDINADGVDDLVFAFENYVVIMVWNNADQKFELFYLKYIELGHTEIQSVIIHDTQNNNNPKMFICIHDPTNPPIMFTYYLKPTFITDINLSQKCYNSDFVLEQNYPNPFNSVTTIYFSLKKPSQINLKICDINGKEVCTLIPNELFSSGMHSVSWKGLNKNGREVSSGIYVYKLITSDYTETKKLIFLK